MFLKLLIVVYVIGSVLFALFHAFSLARSLYFSRPTNHPLAMIGFYKDRVANRLYDRPMPVMYYHEWQAVGIFFASFVGLVYVSRHASFAMSFLYLLAMAINIVTLILVGIAIRERIDALQRFFRRR